MRDLQAQYQHSKNLLQQAGIPTAALDARLLICHVLGLTHEAFILQQQRVLTASEQHAVDAIITQRLQRRPVAKIIGHKEFYGRNFITTDDTLDPRPDSETLIEAVLSSMPDTPQTVLDLGTGTGCLALTLLVERLLWRAVAVDVSPAALAVARKNASILGVGERVTFVQGSWLEGITDTFDMIISNPPYVPRADQNSLAPELGYDPERALYGGDTDGCAVYRHLVPQLGRFLAPGGLVAFEVGQHQAAIVADLLAAQNFVDRAVKADLAGIPRVVMGRK